MFGEASDTSLMPFRDEVVAHDDVTLGEHTTARFMAAIPYPAPEASPSPPAPDRPSLRLALFWGPGDPFFPVPKRLGRPRRAA